MGYELYRSVELAHSAKGTGWKNHKYISKYFKNGKWFYLYKTGLGKSKDTDQHTIDDAEKEEYYKIEKDKNGNYRQVKYTEYTTKGNSWLSKKFYVNKGTKDVQVYKTKGKIEQGFEKAAASGKAFIESLSKKKKKK